ncbi:MAG: 16S rRNA (cytidine(1402)-2'-O)-methyltransferase [Anaerotignaceae bacterium]
MSGTLYLCATPIGNLDDITLRVLNLLKTCDLIAAEDTRHTLKLLNHFDINTPMTSYHDHNRISKGPYLIEKLKSGVNIALVTDAGMPGISDPGEDLARLCYEEGVPVTVAPGASAAVTALVLSGMDTRRFVFEGFLPVDKKEKAKVLSRLEREERTTIFYEAPHRLTDTLGELFKAVGNRNAACIRELTKKFEEVRKAPIEELLMFYKENPPRGEFVVIIEGADGEALRQEEIEGFEKMSLEEHMNLYTNKGMTEKEAMKQVAKDRGLTKRDIYAKLKQ